MCKLSKIEIPRNFEEAWLNEDWKNATQEEQDVGHSGETQGNKNCGVYRLLFTVKYNVDGPVERYKVRLVANGYIQTYQVDYLATFSSVAKINSIRVLPSLAVNLDWPVLQLDVKNAFLNGDLDEEVLMELPPGFNNVGEGKV